MKTVYYARVSTLEQNIARQLPDTDDKVYWDKCSGMIPFMDREAASELITDAKDGHVGQVNVKSIDRLGRNAIDVLKTIKWFTEHGINVKSEKEGLNTLLENGKQNPVAKLLVSVLSTLAEIDYNNRREAQREGIAIAKAQGKYKGRKKGTGLSEAQLLDKHDDIVTLLDRDLSIREIATLAGKSKTTVMKVKKTWR